MEDSVIVRSPMIPGPLMVARSGVSNGEASTVALSNTKSISRQSHARRRNRIVGSFLVIVRTYPYDAGSHPILTWMLARGGHSSDAMRGIPAIDGAVPYNTVGSISEVVYLY